MIASKKEKILQFPYVVQEHRTAADADYFTTVNKNKSSVVINVACSCLKLKRHQHATRAGVVCLLYLIVQPLTYQWYINQTKNMKARKVFYRLVFIVVFCILKVNKRYRPFPFTISWLASLSIKQIIGAKLILLNLYKSSRRTADKQSIILLTQRWSLGFNSKMINI